MTPVDTAALRADLKRNPVRIPGADTVRVILPVEAVSSIADELDELRLHKESANAQCKHYADENERLRKWRHAAEPVVGAARWLVINREHPDGWPGEVENIANALSDYDAALEGSK